MKYANMVNSKFSIIINEKELKDDQITLKNMQEDFSKTVSLTNFLKEFSLFFNR